MTAEWMGERSIVGRWDNAVIAAAILAAVALDALPARAQPLSVAELGRYSIQIETGDAAERAAAADILGRRCATQRDEVVPLLVARLRTDRDWRVRASSGRAIGRLAARDAVPSLVRALRDPVVDVRVVAAAALWRLPDPAAVEPLLELLRDPEAAARQWAALALGVIRDRRATGPMLSLLGDPEEEVRLDALRSIGRLRDPAAVRPLETFARDASRDMDERLESINALSSLEGPESVNALVRLLDFGDVRVRSQAVAALGRVGDALVLPALRQRRSAERVGSVREAIDGSVREIERRAASGGSNDTSVPLNLPPMP
jgi:HEAT repeat protein